MAYGAGFLDLSWAIGVPGFETNNKETIVLVSVTVVMTQVCWGSIHSLKCFCTAILSSDVTQDSTEDQEDLTILLTMEMKGQCQQ